MLHAIDGIRGSHGGPGVPRLRFVTSHPWDLTERLIEAVTIDYDELQAMTEAHVNGQDLKQLQAA